MTDAKITPEIVRAISSEYILNYVRFQLLKNKKKDQMLTVFKQLANVPIKSPELLHEFTSLLTSGTLDDFQKFSKRNYIPELHDLDRLAHLEKEAAQIDYKMYTVKKDIRAIMEVYFQHDDETDALNVLRHLLFYQCEIDADGPTPQEQWDTYFRIYQKMDPDGQRMNTSCWNPIVL